MVLFKRNIYLQIATHCNVITQITFFQSAQWAGAEHVIKVRRIVCIIIIIMYQIPMETFTAAAICCWTVTKNDFESGTCLEAFNCDVMLRSDSDSEDETNAPFVPFTGIFWCVYMDKVSGFKRSNTGLIQVFNIQNMSRFRFLPLFTRPHATGFLWIFCIKLRSDQTRFCIENRVNAL